MSKEEEKSGVDGPDSKKVCRCDDTGACLSAIRNRRCVSCGKTKPAGRCKRCGVPVCDERCMKSSWSDSTCPHRKFCRDAGGRLCDVGAKEGDATAPEYDFARRYAAAVRRLTRDELDGMKNIDDCIAERTPIWSEDSAFTDTDEIRGVFFHTWIRNNIPDPRRVDSPSSLYHYVWVLGCYEIADSRRLVLLMPISEPTRKMVHAMPDLLSTRNDTLHRFDTFKIFRTERFENTLTYWIPGEYYAIERFRWAMPCWVAEKFGPNPAVGEIAPEETGQTDISQHVGMGKRTPTPESRRESESEVGKDPIVEKRRAVVSIASSESPPKKVEEGNSSIDVDAIKEWRDTPGGPPSFEAYRRFGPRKGEEEKEAIRGPFVVGSEARELAESYEQRTFGWLNLRNAFVTGSKAATYCGLNQYEPQLQQFELDVMRPHLPPMRPNEAMEYGTEHEPDAFDSYVAAFGLVEGVRVIKPRGLVIHPGPDKGYMAASPDGFVGDDGLLELKTSAKRLYDSPPSYWLVQVQHTMSCTNRKWCDLAAFYLPRGNDARSRESDDSMMRVWRIPRDDAFVELMHSVLERYVTLVLEAREAGGFETNVADYARRLMSVRHDQLPPNPIPRTKRSVMFLAREEAKGKTIVKK